MLIEKWRMLIIHTGTEQHQRKSSGKLATLADWLRENIYQHGSCYTAPELIERVAGEPLSIAPIVRYLKNKFATLYDI